MRSKQFLTFFLLFLSSCVLVAAQASRRDFNRPQRYDVEHYVIRVGFDRADKRVNGVTTIRFRPLKNGFKTVEFDAVAITFQSVTLEPAGTPLTHRTANGQVIVTLDRAYSPTETITVRFKHTATPKKGVYFVAKEVDENGKQVHSDQIWTQGEPDEARHWFPSFDFPSDKATFEQYITANAGEEIIGNGELVEELKNADGTVTFHYHMKAPMPTYLVSFVIGDYSLVTDKYRDVPLGYYVYPGTEAIVPKAYGETKDMMRVFESLTGIDYPFNKYDQTMVSDFAFGGMENVTATTMADSEIFAVNNPLFAAGVGDLVSHELAHSWFGNLVTCRNWAELWLNEGFATFMEAVYREKAYGRGSYINKIMRDAQIFMIDDVVNRKRTALFNEHADDVAGLFDHPATNYSKGGAVLHTLREEIGDEAFWKGVNIYLTRHRLGSVESTDLKRAMEEASKRDLGWFFDQWVYKGGHPKLDVRHVWNPRSKTVKLTVTQTQKPDKITPAAFRLPLEVEFTNRTTKTTQKIAVTKRTEVFSVEVPSKPTKVTVDPDQRIPVKFVKTL